MDETRLKAIEAALSLCRSTGAAQIYTAGQLLAAAREIEAYLQHRDEADTPKASPHPAMAQGLAN